MSPPYAAGCRALDTALGALCRMLDRESDYSTMLVALADHGGGGTSPREHESAHPVDVTIPLTFAGASITAGTLAEATLLDVPATVLYALGIPVPSTYEGQTFTSIFAGALATALA